MEKVISASTANNLFWLGRYVERGYLLLHLMRKAYDEVIDVPVGETPYSNFLNKINGYSCSTFTTSYQMMQQIYDVNNPTSLRSVIERMMDNAIVLRPEIYSESFSYIELCRDKIASEAEKGQMNITDL
ncbi:MAG: alpha-E domain-containing protein, partial [Candidatus Cryptobacteroides sp.]